jgi:acyl-CoA thioesterase-1
MGARERKSEGARVVSVFVRLCGFVLPRSLALSLPRSCLLLCLCLPGLRAESLAILGDSLTAGYGLDESQAYPALVQQALRLSHPTWTVINAGVSGDTSTGALRRVDWVLKAKPTLLMIAIGANDGLRGQPLETFEANLRAIVAKAVAAKSTPVLAGMQLPINLGAEYRAGFEAVYARVAQDTRTPLLPFLLAGVAMQPTLNQTDGIHPNAAGQEIIAKTVLNFLEPHLR